MKRNFAPIVCLVGLILSSRAAELKQKTTTAFDRYVAATEARINSELRPGGIFLYVDAQQADAMKGSYDKLMNGEVLVEPCPCKSGKKYKRCCGDPKGSAVPAVRPPCRPK
jgi:uncharacterized protein YchJ